MAAGAFHQREAGMIGNLMVTLIFFALCRQENPRQAPAEKEVQLRVNLIGESDRTARRLAQADELVAEGKQAEALDAYMQIINDAGDDLIPQGPHWSIQVRRLCFQRIVKQPEALRLYRDRVDIQARQWFEKAQSARDVPGLRKVVDDAFCSSWAAAALDLLGDLAFERGEFAMAQLYWSMLGQPASWGTAKNRNSQELVFPDPSTEVVASVRAKQIVADIFEGRLEEAYAETRAFESLHSTAQGHLCGQQGNYAKILESLIRDSMKLSPVAVKDEWPTFAHDAGRGNRIHRSEGVLARLPQAGEPTWSVRLDTRQKTAPTGEAMPAIDKIMAPAKESRGLAFYPVISGDRVFVADGRYISGYDLLTGQRALEYDLLLHHKSEDASALLHLPLSGEINHTLTINDGKAYARLGAVLQTGSRSKDEDRGGHSFFVCINLNPSSGGRLEQWSIASKGTAPNGPLFEGAPLVAQGRVYVALSQMLAGQVRTALACYDANTGAPRWQKDICEIPEAREGLPAGRQPLLTLAGANVVYCAHTGAIVAVDLLTGHRSWSVRYPSRGNKLDSGEPSPRALAPCLFSDDRTFVAPADYGRLICLDAATGRELWQSAPLETVHIMGVADGRLILTATSPVPCIRTLDAATGNPLRSWLQPANGTGLTTFGRGLLAGDVVLWPTRGKNGDRIHVLRNDDGQPVDEAAIPAGNLASGNGCLVVAGTEFLSAYIPEKLMHDLRFSAAHRSRVEIAEGEKPQKERGDR
jgi:outer membrane protein assembly factor BamB